MVEKIKWGKMIYAPGGLLSGLSFLILMDFLFLFNYLWDPMSIWKVFKRILLKFNGSAA